MYWYNVHILQETSEEKLQKQNRPKFDWFIMKIDVKCFGRNNLLQDFKFTKSVVKIEIDVWWNKRRKENVYKKKKEIHNNVFTSVFGLLSSSLLLFPQRFGQYILRPSSGVCRTQKPSTSFVSETCVFPVHSLENVFSKIRKIEYADPWKTWRKAPFSIATTSKAQLLSLDCSTLHLIRTLYSWVLSKEVSSTIFKVLGMMWPGIESRSPWPLANTLPTTPMSRSTYIYEN